jgi:hypothetical protein
LLQQVFNKSSNDIKSWEHSLIERTRGQIAWLELQKINFKKHGNVEKVSTIKKQQRAIIMRLEKERAQMRENSEQSVMRLNQQLNESIEITGNESEARENIER